MFKKLIKSIAGSYLYARKSYAQEGEDLVIDRLLEDQEEGFYIDVGCHHPFRFSNTYHFYRRGWRGVCIDPLPGTKKLFSRWRPRDTVIEMGVSSEASELTYYMFNEPALNTFDPKQVEKYDGLQNYKVIQQTRVSTDTLENVLQMVTLPPAEDIALLSVDVEGLDLEVLQSNNWNRVHPRIVVAECREARLSEIHKDPVSAYLNTQGYEPSARTGNSIIFVHG